MPHLVTQERFRVVRSTPLLLPTFSTNKGMTSIGIVRVESRTA